MNSEVGAHDLYAADFTDLFGSQEAFGLRCLVRVIGDEGADETLCISVLLHRFEFDHVRD